MDSLNSSHEEAKHVHVITESMACCAWGCLRKYCCTSANTCVLSGRSLYFAYEYNCSGIIKNGDTRKYVSQVLVGFLHLLSISSIYIYIVYIFVFNYSFMCLRKSQAQAHTLVH